MSERLLKVLLEELKLVRVRCPACKVVVEMDVKQAIDQLGAGLCRCCNHPLGVIKNGSNQLVRLASAISELHAIQEIPDKGAEITFVLPDRTDEKKRPD